MGTPRETEEIPNFRPVHRGPKSWALALMAASTMVGVLSGLGVGSAQAQVVQVQAQPAQAPATMTTDLTSRALVSSRSGHLLGHGMILKVDNYPGLHTESLQTGEHPQPKLTGAPNFRQVPDANIYGVAQPTREGLHNVLRQLNAGPGQTGPEVTWTTLREEPVIYIGGQSLTLRAEAHPFTNMESPGISAHTVEEREVQLKAEILKEASQHGGRLLVHDEMPDGSVVARYVDVNETTVQTPREIFEQAKAEGYRVNYARVAITDEKAPENADFDEIVNRLKGVSPDSPLVFNCHAGRGRTTTGTVIGELIRGQGDTGPIQGSDSFEQGNFRIIGELIDGLDNGTASKEGVDRAIDRAGSVTNLRLAIARLKQKAADNPNRVKAEKDIATGKDYLHRYYKLVAFNSYLQEQGPQGFPTSFSDWINQHPEANITPDLIELVYNHTASNGTALA